MSYLAQWLATLFHDDDVLANRLITVAAPDGSGDPIVVPADQLPTFPNHGRTLLLNLLAGDLRQPYEEYISPQFRPLTLSSSLTALRRHLFGVNPDRLGLNYWINQYMLVAHTTELNEYVVGLDPRITYLGNPPPTSFGDEVFGVQIAAAPGTTAELYLQGDSGLAVDRNGRLQYRWQVAVGSNEVTMSLQTPPARVITEAYSVSDGLSDSHTLPGSLLQVRFPEGSAGSQWVVTVTARPANNLGDIVAQLRTAADVSFDEVFGVGTIVGNTEPFLTFRNLWRDHPESLYSFGGLLCAAMYQTELLRRGGL